MKELQLTKFNLAESFNQMQSMLDDEPVLIVSINKPGTGKWSMARLWRAWMSSTAKHLAANGATMPLMLKSNGGLYGSRHFNKDDAHELFTAQWLGVDIDGSRLSWAKTSHDGMRAATKGERLIAMQKHEAWSSERGIQLMVPRDSEYFKENV